MCVTSLLCGPRANLWPFYGFLCKPLVYKSASGLPQKVDQFFRSLRSWRYCIVVEWDLTEEPSREAKRREAVFQPPRPYSLFFGTRLRCQNFNLAPTQYRQLRRLVFSKLFWLVERIHWARSIQPKFPEISVQNSMDRFGPTGKVSKKRVYLLRLTTFPGRTGWNFGWMNHAHWVLDRTLLKFWLNGSRPGSSHVFSQCLRLFWCAYLVEVHKHAWWIQL